MFSNFFIGFEYLDATFEETCQFCQLFLFGTKTEYHECPLRSGVSDMVKWTWCIVAEISVRIEIIDCIISMSCTCIYDSFYFSLAQNKYCRATVSASWFYKLIQIVNNWFYITWNISLCSEKSHEFKNRIHNHIFLKTKKKIQFKWQLSFVWQFVLRAD